MSVTGACTVRPTDISGAGGSPVLVIDCGYATARDDVTHWNRDCGPTGFPCPPLPGNAHPHQFITTYALTHPPVPIASWCAGVDTPMPSRAALRDEVIRLLTAPAVGVSPSSGTGLVNLKTLFWVDTPTTRDLGRARLVGFPVRLRVHYLRTEFDYGDGANGVLAPTPGTPYDPGSDCGTCSDRFGHTYAEPGRVTITARTYWRAEFEANGQWVEIPGDVTALQPATVPLTLAQAHSTLVSR